MNLSLLWRDPFPVDDPLPGAYELQLPRRA